MVMRTKGERPGRATERLTLTNWRRAACADAPVASNKDLCVHSTMWLVVHVLRLCLRLLYLPTSSPS